MKKFFRTRQGWFLMLIIVSAIVSLLFGGLLYLLGDMRFWECLKGGFLFVGTLFAISAVLTLFTSLDSVMSIVFGAAVYYGGIFISRILGFHGNRKIFGLLLAYLICSLVYEKEKRR